MYKDQPIYILPYAELRKTHLYLQNFIGENGAS